MSHHDPNMDPKILSQLASAASTLGHEIVDVSGFFELIEQHASAQKSTIGELKGKAGAVAHATDRVLSVTSHLSAAASQSLEAASETVQSIQASDKSSRDVAAWVSDLSDRTNHVSSTLEGVSKNNAQIVSIARQVNTLAINAKIEAARAGDAGRGFSVVADAINDLSHQTSTAAVQISENVETLATWIVQVAKDAKGVSERAAEVLQNSEKNNENLTAMETSLQESHKQVENIVAEAEKMQQIVQSFKPNLADIDKSTSKTTQGISQATKRINNLIDTSEALVQANAALGNAGNETKFFTYVQSTADQISRAFDAAIASGKITETNMFSTTYTPVPGTNPEQVTAPYTRLLDEILPPLQEPALELDSKVVFCAAVDQNGYLPTHNRKFSQPQGNDPTWNAANSRNRRIFDDRVGLKAGRNKEPFLMQVYRRDMGGGQFTMMKDISAPIYVQGRHWGGLRLAIKF